jgi:hypothetical protein
VVAVTRATATENATAKKRLCGLPRGLAIGLIVAIVLVAIVGGVVGGVLGSGNKTVGGHHLRWFQY